MRLPQRVDVEQRWLQLCQLYGCDAHRPDVTQFIVATFYLHGCHLWRHPEDRRGTATIDFNTADEQSGSIVAPQLFLSETLLI